MTIPEAARQAGYYSRTSLHMAAESGRLRTVCLAEGKRLTRREWVDAFVKSTGKKGAANRGREKRRW